MIFTTAQGKSFDTETDLTAPERHILQKLFLWESLAGSLEEFRQRKAEALERGWNHSGAIPESAPMTCIIQELESRLARRLKDPSQPT